MLHSTIVGEMLEAVCRGVAQEQPRSERPEEPNLASHYIDRAFKWILRRRATTEAELHLWLNERVRQFVALAEVARSAAGATCVDHCNEWPLPWLGVLQANDRAFDVRGHLIFDGGEREFLLLAVGVDDLIKSRIGFDFDN